QTCNTRAIDFYIKNGFIVNGIDLSCYSNDDVEKKEVRLELVYKL
ncbi:MAG: GNAT family N-acetyltransferase, partial [Tissierellia bacterium]|nr:GNAT family N-acetyltransferase [Tissierellia bacterium]